MPAWKGNPSNQVPNYVQEDSSLSEKRVDENRSLQVRRDTDKVKDSEISLYDVDRVIIEHLHKLNFTVTDEGKIIKIPIFYGSPEKWVAARRDGYFRDKQGKIQLPLMLLRRVNSENDDDMETFHKYLKYPIIKRYSPKNKYTRFSLLTNQNVPTNEVYNITIADHMVLTYSFMVWTEYHEQMNEIIEKIKFNTKDYWGSPRGFRFRTRIDNFSHTVELNTDEDRIVKTEFDLVTNGYILPKSYNILDRQYPTTEKLFTPKKIIMNMEVVGSDFDFRTLDKNSEKWRSQKYPNISKNDEALLGIHPTLSEQSKENIYKTYSDVVSKTVDVQWHLPAPTNSTDYGVEGWQSYDTDYYYLYSGGEWKRVPLALFNTFAT